MNNPDLDQWKGVNKKTLRMILSVFIIIVLVVGSRYFYSIYSQLPVVNRAGFIGPLISSIIVVTGSMFVLWRTTSQTREIQRKAAADVQIQREREDRVRKQQDIESITLSLAEYAGKVEQYRIAYVAYYLKIEEYSKKAKRKEFKRIPSESNGFRTILGDPDPDVDKVSGMNKRIFNELKKDLIFPHNDETIAPYYYIKLKVLGTKSNGDKFIEELERIQKYMPQLVEKKLMGNIMDNLFQMFMEFAHNYIHEDAYYPTVESNIKPQSNE